MRGWRWWAAAPPTGAACACRYPQHSNRRKQRCPRGAPDRLIGAPDRGATDSCGGAPRVLICEARPPAVPSLRHVRGSLPSAVVHYQAPRCWAARIGTGLRAVLRYWVTVLGLSATVLGRAYPVALFRAPWYLVPIAVALYHGTKRHGAGPRASLASRTEGGPPRFQTGGAGPPSNSRPRREAPPTHPKLPCESLISLAA